MHFAVEEFGLLASSRDLRQQNAIGSRLRGLFMRFRRLGNSGLTVSVVGLGTNNFGMKLDLDGCREVLDAALDAGVTVIDTADSYGKSEENLGQLLGARRDDVILATKFGSDSGRLGNSNGAD